MCAQANSGSVDGVNNLCFLHELSVSYTIKVLLNSEALKTDNDLHCNSNEFPNQSILLTML